MKPSPEGDARRDAIMAFIADFWTEHHYGPTYQEIAAGVGLRSMSSVVYQVRILLEAECLTMAPGKGRTLRVVEL